MTENGAKAFKNSTVLFFLIFFDFFVFWFHKASRILARDVTKRNEIVVRMLEDICKESLLSEKRETNPESALLASCA